ncbi:MAG TPA: hypothetical protein VH591_11095 [Ktedonobacterales bacterium]|jgi:hypothetical protein
MKQRDGIPQTLEKPPMGQTVSLDLPPDLAQRAAAVAQQTHRRVEDVLLEWLGRAASDVPIESLPDEQVLALADREMSQSEQRELSALLARQREGTQDQVTRHRLDELMASYRRGMVEKARALKVAVERGLRPPLDTSA